MTIAKKFAAAIAATVLAGTAAMHSPARADTPDPEYNVSLFWIAPAFLALFAVITAAKGDHNPQPVSP